MYRHSAPGHASLVVLAALLVMACKKKTILDDPDERGKLSKIAQRLDEGLGDKPMPGLPEPEKLGDRLARWDDFRSCTVRAFIARKRAADRARADGTRPPGHNGTLGEAAVEECAVESAIVNKDRTMCERLAIDFEGPSGETPLAAARCWDTRARILGLPDECPVVWLPDDLPGRNPECLAAARRDPSLCSFADSPVRCRAILGGDPRACDMPGAPPDCHAAVTYWSGLLPPPTGQALFDPIRSAPPDRKPVQATIDIRWPDLSHETIRIDAPQSVCALSWPGGKAKVGWTEDTTPFWGVRVPADAAQISLREGLPAVKLAFVPAGASSGVRPVQPEGAAMAATVSVVWPDPRAYRRCVPGPQTKGQVRYDAGAAQAGSFLMATFHAEGLACSDGSTVTLHAEVRALITDVR